MHGHAVVHIAFAALHWNVNKSPRAAQVQPAARTMAAAALGTTALAIRTFQANSQYRKVDVARRPAHCCGERPRPLARGLLSHSTLLPPRYTRSHVLTQHHASSSVVPAAAARQGQGRSGGGRRQQQQGGGDEDVEIFNIESGWKIDSLEGLEDLLDAAGEGWSVEAAPEPTSSSGRRVKSVSGSSGSAASSLLDDGWSVEAVGSAPSDDLSDFVDEGDFELGSDDEEWEEAGGSSQRGAAAAPEAQPVTFGGRVLGKAEQQVLASLPRHMLRRLEAEQREADAGECSVHKWSSCEVHSACLFSPLLGHPCWLSRLPLLAQQIAGLITSCRAERERLRPSAQKKAAARLKTHQQLRIISGTAAGRRLRSPQGDQVGGCCSCCCSWFPIGLQCCCCGIVVVLSPPTPACLLLAS